MSGRFRSVTGMTFFLGMAALILAVIGTYGVIAYAINLRMKEIGIRLALGAESTIVKWMVVLHGMRLAAAGIAVGMVAAAGLSRFIASFLFGVTALDPIVFLSIPAVLTTVALAAVWIPASRASRRVRRARPRPHPRCRRRRLPTPQGPRGIPPRRRLAG